MSGGAAVLTDLSRAPADALPHDWPGAASSRFVDAAGLRWHVQVRGDGPALVLLHGAGASLHSFAPLVERLCDRRRCIAFDLPGHGFTAPFASGDYTLRRTAAAVQALLRRLDVGDHSFVGHSAGAAIALQCVLDAPRADDAPDVIAINPALRPFGGVAGVAFPVLARLAASSGAVAGLIARRATRRDQIRRLIAGTGSAIPDTMLDCYQFLLRRPGHVRGVLSMMAGWQLDGLVRAVRAREPRLHVILGARDRAVPPRQTERTLAGLPGVTLSWLQDCGHLAHEEAPGAVAGLMLQRRTRGDDDDRLQ